MCAHERTCKHGTFTNTQSSTDSPANSHLDSHSRLMEEKEQVDVMKFEVQVSVTEVYNEQIQDLLALEMVSFVMFSIQCA